MSLTLSASDLARFADATRALLSPLDASSLDGWRSEVNRTLRALFRADHALFGLPAETGYFFSDDLDPQTVDGCRYFTEGPMLNGAHSDDPLVNLFFERRRLFGVDVINYAVVDQLLEGRINASAYQNEVLLAGRLREMLGCFTTMPQGDATAVSTTAIYYEDPDKAPFGEMSLAVLRALVPAFKAGVEALARLTLQHALLDEMAEALFVADHAGRELHRNRALTRLLEAEPERARVLEAIQRMARELAGLAFPTSGALGQAPPAPVLREVPTDATRYSLRGVLTTSGSFGSTGAVMVAVAPASGPQLPSVEALRARFALTRREAEVALLLAEGLSNEQIAGRLYVSPHTVRHHAEHIFGKLAINTRKNLALKLLGA